MNSSLDARAAEYVEPIRITKPILKNRLASDDSIRQAGDLWLKLADSGKLPQIYPGYYGESLVDGPKSDIFVTISGIANHLSEIAEKENISHDKRAMSDAIRSLALLDIVRFGSYESMLSTSSYNRKPLKLLKDGVATLTPNEKAWLLKIQDPKARDLRIRQLTDVNRHLRIQYASRYGDQLTAQDDPSYSTYVKRDGSHIAAEHFFGFDRENGLQAALKK